MSWRRISDCKEDGEEYSKLFHSGFRAISLRPFAEHDHSTRVTSANEMHNRRKTPPLPYYIPRKRNLPSSGSVDTHISHGHRGAYAQPSFMSVSSASDLWSSEDSDSEIEEYKKFFVDDYLAPPLGDCTTPLSSPSLRSCPNYVTPWDVPSPNESFLSLAHSPITLTHPNRERGFSIESLAPSLLSSLDLTNNEIQNTDDAWMLEQSSPRLHAQERGGVDADVSDMSFDVDKADWRQFHIDWLSTLTPTQHISRSDRTISTATRELF